MVGPIEGRQADGIEGQGTQTREPDEANLLDGL